MPLLDLMIAIDIRLLSVRAPFLSAGGPESYIYALTSQTMQLGRQVQPIVKIPNINTNFRDRTSVFSEIFGTTKSCHMQNHVGD